MIKHRTLIALLILSNAVSSQASYGFGLEDAKHLVNENEAIKQSEPSLYANALLYLAVEYFKAGNLEKANKTFRKSIKPAEKAESMYPGTYAGHLMMYAQLLSEGRDGMSLQKEDFKLVDAALIEALKAIDARPAADNVRDEYTYVVEIFDKTGNIKLRDKYKNRLLDFCKQVENDSNASKGMTLAVATLDKLAEIEFPAGPIRELPTHVVKLEPDSNTASKLTESRFKRAEALKLRAVKLGDRLPKDDAGRIDLHRQMVYWYTLFGQTKKADEQKEVLSGLLGAKSLDMLFPPRQPCLGCGMG